MRIVLIIAITLVALVAASMLQGEMAPRMLMQSPTMKSVSSAKTGQVFDPTTGLGVPQATVVATGYYTAELNRASVGALLQPWGHSGSGGYVRGVLYTIGTQTDSEGHFNFPDTRNASWEALRNASGPVANYSLSAGWKIDIFKPGYAIEGAEIARSFDKYDNPMHPQFHLKGERPPSYDPPKFKWMNDAIEIDAIKIVDIKELKLSPKEEVVFYHEQYLSASPDWHYILGKQVVNLYEPINGPMKRDDPRRRVFGRLKELACSAEPDSEMSRSEVSAYLYFAPDPQNFLRTLQQLEPSGFQKGYSMPVMNGQSLYRASDVCKSFWDS